MLLPPEYGYPKPQKVCSQCFLRLGEISSEEKGAIDEACNELQEEIVFSAFVIVESSTLKKIKLAQHIIIVGKYRILLFVSKKIAHNLHFYDMKQVLISKDSVSNLSSSFFNAFFNFFG